MRRVRRAAGGATRLRPNFGTIANARPSTRMEPEPRKVPQKTRGASPERALLLSWNLDTEVVFLDRGERILL